MVVIGYAKLDNAGIGISNLYNYDRISFVVGRHRAGKQLCTGKVPGLVSFHGRIKEAGNRHWHGVSNDFRSDSRFRVRVSGGKLHPSPTWY